MSLSRTTPHVGVVINGNEVEAAHCVDVTEVTGGNRTNRATIIIHGSGGPYNSAINEPTFSDRQLAEYFADDGLVEIYISDPSNIVHFGRIVGGRAVSTESQVTYILTSRLDGHMLGHPLWGVDVADYEVSDDTRPRVFSRRIVNIAVDCVFNPLVDGRPVPNMHLPGGNTPLMRDPDSISTITDNENTASFWTLSHAVTYLCYLLNPETYVANPDLSDAQSVLPFRELPQTRIPIGMTLTKALDRLLKPYGCSWFVDPVRRTIRFIGQPGSGPGIQVTQPVAAHNFEWDHVDQTATRAMVMGGYLRKEATFELMPAWEEKYDGYTMSQCQRHSQEWETDPSLPPRVP